MKVGSLLRSAGALLDAPIDDVGGGWPRGAAVMIRQAIEGTMAVWWSNTEPAMRWANGAERWAALPCFLPDAELVAEAHQAWSALSEACHHRGYDLGLTEPELREYLHVAKRFAALVHQELSTSVQPRPKPNSLTAR